MKLFCSVLFLVIARIPVVTAESVWDGPQDNYFSNIGTDGEYIRTFQFSVSSKQEDPAINFVFSSKPIHQSKYLGHGWRIPTLEAVCYKKNEHNYQAELPNGRTITLIKDQNSNFKGIDSDWKGTAKGDLFQLLRGVSDTVTYRKGELESFTIENSTFEIRRSLAGASILKEGKLLYNVDKSSESLLDKVQVKNAEGQIVSRFDVERPASLNGLDQLRSFSIGNLATETSLRLNEDKLPIGMSIGDQKIEWDPLSGKVKQIGDFTYQIECAEGRIDKIQRSGLDAGVKVSKTVDAKKGITISHLGNNIEEKRYYTTGSLDGNIRRYIKKTNGTVSSDITYYYNESGGLIAKIGSKESMVLQNDNLSFQGGSSNGLKFNLKTNKQK